MSLLNTWNAAGLKGDVLYCKIHTRFETFYLSVHFKNVCLYLLMHCCNSCFKVFDFISNICIISGMLFMDFFFPHVEIFLFLHIPYNFGLYSEPFKYYMWDCGLYLNPKENVDFFVWSVASRAECVQDIGSYLSSGGRGSNISSVL